MMVELSDEAAQYVEEQVRAGRFASRQAAVEAAVARLRAGPLEDPDELRSLLHVGIAEVERGEFDDTPIEDLIAERRAAWTKREGGA